MSEQHDSELLFPWETDAAAAPPAGPGAAPTEATPEAPQMPAGKSRDTTQEAPSSRAAADAGAAADAPRADAAEADAARAATGSADEGSVDADSTDAGSADAPDAGAGSAAAQVSAGSAAGPAPADAPDEDEGEGEDDARFDVLDTELGRRAAQRAAAALRERPIAQKEYYAISEVCDLVGLKPHVLRYWETQFQVLNPSKNRSGNRVYQRKEIKLVMLVKHLLYDEKYTVEGARAKLDQLKRTGEIADATARSLDRETAEALRTDLSELIALLTPAHDE